jgi:hypothetical protein
MTQIGTGESKGRSRRYAGKAVAVLVLFDGMATLLVVRNPG